MWPVTGGSSECVFEQGRFTCRQSDLKVGGKATFTVILTPTGAGDLTLIANVGATGADPAFATNRVTVIKDIAPK